MIFFMCTDTVLTGNIRAMEAISDVVLVTTNSRDASTYISCYGKLIVLGVT